MNELQYLFNAICQRRGVAMNKVENVAFSMRLEFGLANLTYLIPAVANTFYVARGFVQECIVTNATASPIIRLTNLGGGSAGNVDIYLRSAVEGVHVFTTAFEFESMQYIVNGNTAGANILLGTVFKITYTP